MEDRKFEIARFGCLGMFLLLYSLPMMIGAIVGANFLLMLFTIMLTGLVFLQLGVPVTKHQSLKIRRLRYFFVMGTILSLSLFILLAASGLAAGTFTYEFSAGMGAAPGDGSASLEIAQGPSWPGQIIFGVMGLLIGWAALKFGIPYGRRLMKETENPSP